KAEGITISPLNAGHLIGGALWKITKESEEIVYAVDYNHAQDRHLDGTVLVDLPRPNILITDAYTALDAPTPGGRKAREGRILEQITSTLQRGGNVLLPSDSTGRVLELMIVLDEYWAQHTMHNVTLAFLSPEGRSTLTNPAPDWAETDAYWALHKMHNVTLAFLSPEGRSTLDMAASQTEWLSKHVNQRSTLDMAASQTEWLSKHVNQRFVQSRRNVFHF
ncbi:beta-lactamase-like protein, partial [Baffinella frigidus]